MIAPGRYTVQNERGRYDGAIFVLESRWSAMTHVLGVAVMHPDGHRIWRYRYAGQRTEFEVTEAELERMVAPRRWP